MTPKMQTCAKFSTHSSSLLEILADQLLDNKSTDADSSNLGSRVFIWSFGRPLGDTAPALNAKKMILHMTKPTAADHIQCIHTYMHTYTHIGIHAHMHTFIALHYSTAHYIAVHTTYIHHITLSLHSITQHNMLYITLHYIIKYCITLLHT